LLVPTAPKSLFLTSNAGAATKFGLTSLVKLFNLFKGS
jgi:hypothetical protein